MRDSVGAGQPDRSGRAEPMFDLGIGTPSAAPALGFVCFGVSGGGTQVNETESTCDGMRDPSYGTMEVYEVAPIQRR